MRYFFDFDSTLYATSRLWEQWHGLLQACGRDSERIQTTADELVPTGFSLESHARILGLDEAGIAHICESAREFMRRHGPALVFPDVTKFFNNRSAGSNAILTYGNSGYQYEKIATAGLHEYFERIHVCLGERAKARLLKELLAGKERAVLIDDNPMALAEIHEDGLPVRLVRIIRDGERYAAPHERDGRLWPTIRTLDELDNVIG